MGNAVRKVFRRAFPCIAVAFGCGEDKSNKRKSGEHRNSNKNGKKLYNAAMAQQVEHVLGKE